MLSLHAFSTRISRNLFQHSRKLSSLTLLAPEIEKHYKIATNESFMKLENEVSENLRTKQFLKFKKNFTKDRSPSCGAFSEISGNHTFAAVPQVHQLLDQASSSSSWQYDGLFWKNLQYGYNVSCRLFIWKKWKFLKWTNCFCSVFRLIFKVFLRCSHFFLIIGSSDMNFPFFQEKNGKFWLFKEPVIKKSL